MKATIRVPRVLSCCMKPEPVITATVSHRGQRRTLVWMTQEELGQVARHLQRDGNKGWFWPSAAGRANLPDPIGFSDTAVDAGRGTFAPDENRLVQARSVESRGDLWLDARFADPVLAALASWRQANLPQADRLWAPNWIVLTAVRKLAVVAGRMAEVEAETPAVAAA